MGEAQRTRTRYPLPFFRNPATHFAIFAQGYRPLRFPRAAEEDNANISDAMRRAYPEAVHCWPTEMAGCLMTFIKDGRYWMVRTYMEAPEHQSAIRPITRADASDIEMIERRLARGRK